MSRQIALSATLALTMAFGMATQTFAGQTYTREDMVKIAMEKSSDIKTAEEDLIQASSKVEAGYGNAYPTIDLSATVTRIFGLKDVKNKKSIQNAFGDLQQAYGLPDPSAYDMAAAAAVDGLIYGMSKQGYRWQSSVGITATQILYAAGQVGTGIEIAKTYKRLNEVKLDNIKSQIRYDVDNAFDQLIYLDSAVAILEASIQLTQENIDFVNQSVASGLATELDQIRAQLALDGLKSDLEGTKKKQILARNALLNIAGLEWESDVVFQGDLRNPDSNLPYPDTAMANVKKRRKELVMLEASEDMLNKSVNIEEAGYKPTVVLVGGIQYSNNQNEFYKWDAPDWDKNINKYIALNVSMNLFNGMKTREGVAQAKSSLRSTQIQKETAERGFRLQIESCANTLEDAVRQLELQKRQVELATKNYELTDAAYKIGRETQLNLLSANMSLRSARLNYMQAVLNWNSAYNALLQATGEY
ncbi:MAG: TolC family protein [Fibrobacter sp.]|nr:TolC family protein [Fibrobacter sp.]